MYGNLKQLKLIHIQLKNFKYLFLKGKFVYEKLSVKEIRDYSMKEKARLWDEIFRLEFPHNYYVDLSKKLLDYKIKMLEEKRK